MSKLMALGTLALLCLLDGEAAADRVAQALPLSITCTANLAEVGRKLRKRLQCGGCARRSAPDVRPLTSAQGYATVHLRPATRTFGLLPGDRACLELAAELGVSARIAIQAGAGAEAEVIR